jgi:hypothetical protein
MPQVMTEPDGGPDSSVPDDPPSLLPIDLAAFADDGEPLSVWPCPSCRAWHAHVVVTDTGDVLIREWHAEDCPHYHAIILER